MCVCSSLCPMWPLANVCHASQWRTVTFSPFSSPKHFLKPLSLWLYASLKCESLHTLTYTLFSSCWVATTGFRNQNNLSLLWFHIKFILFIYSFLTFFFLLIPLLFTEPRQETGVHLHLYGKMYCIDKNNRRIFISCSFFQMLTQFWSILQRQASSCSTVIAALFPRLWSE